MGDAGSEDEDGEHIPYSPLSGEEAGEAVQLTMVLYHQEDYNRARRWRLPKCTLAPGEYQVTLALALSPSMALPGWRFLLRCCYSGTEP